MSNLSQFFGGGGPSNIRNGSTLYSGDLEGGDAQAFPGSPISTGVFVADSSRTVISSAHKGDIAFIECRGVGGAGYVYSSLEAAAYIDNSDNQVKIAVGGIRYASSDDRSGIFTGVVYWSFAEYD